MKNLSVVSYKKANLTAEGNKWNKKQMYFDLTPVGK